MGEAGFRGVIMRGGTSKGLFCRKDWLPPDREAVNRLLLRAMGSPDPYGGQLDGLGGATSSTSKIAIISPSERPDSDVDYLFGQVLIRDPVIDYAGTCGNLTAAVGPFAIDEGLVRTAEGEHALVRIWLENTGKRVNAYVPLVGNRLRIDGDYSIDGVPGTGAEIRLEFLDPGSSVGKSICPTGSPRDVLRLDDGDVEVSIIDIGLPVVFVRAQDVDLKGTELQDAINSNAGLLSRLEELRSQAAAAIGLSTNANGNRTQSAAIPKIALIGPPASYVSSRGAYVDTGMIDLTIRAISVGRLHHAVPLTVAMCAAAATRIPGTLPNAVRGPEPAAEAPVRLGHTAGRIEIAAAVRQHQGEWSVDKVVVGRTARRLMEGFISV